LGGHRRSEGERRTRRRLAGRAKVRSIVEVSEVCSAVAFW
jgi:hypothetical protein